MIKLDEDKLAKLRTSSEHFDEKYGPKGSSERKEFEARAEAWYYADLLKEERKRQKLTQKQLGERIGKKREYISALERGKTDMQLSTFMLIANALGLRFSLVVG
ncbi:MAG: helix-turn-helix transcriptional regulator [Prevotella sp.]|nr:helix-turn-helix transcriptional regulator [Prevotella sp.]MBR5060823.1 helix-turn-helix transcriptional regulator [Prevotella sp.]